jgi:type I restriction enzyme S subunit
VQKGDFILSNSMSFGRPYIMDTDGCIHDGWLVLSDRASHFDQDYLYHFLGSQAAFRQFDRLAAGSTVRNLNIDLVSSVKLPVPPLEIQKDIANELEGLSGELNRLKVLIRRKIHQLDALKQSLLQRAFSGQLAEEPLAA